MGDDGSTPDASSPDLAGILSGAGASLGSGAASAVLDAANSAVPNLGYSAGASAAQGALDTLSPYLPYIAAAVLVFVLLDAR